jgi:hypothetical protein
MTAKRYRDLLSTFQLTLSKGDAVVAQATVEALDEDDALSDAMSLRRNAGISIFDTTAKVTVARLHAHRT